MTFDKVAKKSVTQLGLLVVINSEVGSDQKGHTVSSLLWLDNLKGKGFTTSFSRQQQSYSLCSAPGGVVQPITSHWCCCC